ncbi:hypothetical protein OG763_03085 [Streptomyces sp. NBC_01230]|uniref:hypothetical protein n=1 Tax=Streptomyces sp. NBC_01230 TaxID=2903784 RepID=UPI002E0DC4AB|nr:hypothetical protein OG763_03085 [Streptomyces sp. NBC_01230]
MITNPGKRRNDLSAASSYEGGRVVLRVRRTEFTVRWAEACPTATGPTAGCEGACRRARSLGQGLEDAL